MFWRFKCRNQIEHFETYVSNRGNVLYVCYHGITPIFFVSYSHVVVRSVSSCECSMQVERMHKAFNCFMGIQSLFIQWSRMDTSRYIHADGQSKSMSCCSLLPLVCPFPHCVWWLSLRKEHSGLRKQTQCDLRHVTNLENVQWVGFRWNQVTMKACCSKLYWKTWNQWDGIAASGGRAL